MSQTELKEYYLSRLTEYLYILREHYQSLSQWQRQEINGRKILSSLSRAKDFPLICGLSVDILKDFGPLCLSQLAQLIQAFKESEQLSQRPSTAVILSHLDALSVHWSNSESQEDVVEQLKSVAHTLSGSGGTFGYDDISSAAALLEYSDAINRLPALDMLIQTIGQHVPLLATERVPEILIVQKDPELLFVMSHCFEDQNCTVQSVVNASDAWSLLEQKSFDLMITDLVLPDMDGRRFVLEIQARQRELPILLLASSVSLQTLKEEALPVTVLAKPFTLDVFLSEAKRLIKKAVQNPPTLKAVFSLLPDMSAFDSQIQALNAGDHTLVYLKADLQSSLFKDWVTDLKTQLNPSYFPAYVKRGHLVLLMPHTSAAESIGFVRSLRLRWEQQSRFAQTEVSFALAPLGTAKVSDQLKSLQELFLENPSEPGIYRKLSKSSHKQTILLADDDPLIASIVCFRLEQAGYTVNHLSSGEHVLATLQKEDISLVILDVKMPGLDGFSVLKNIRKAGLTLPVVMLTALGDEAQVVEGFRLGANEYLTKPFSPDEFLSRIQRLF